MAESLFASWAAATKSWLQELDPHVDSNNRYGRCVKMSVFFEPRKRVKSKLYVSDAVHHPGVGGVVVMLDPLADADFSCLRGCLVVQVSVATQLHQEGVVLRKRLVGGVRVACKHRFTLPAGIFRISPRQTQRLGIACLGLQGDLGLRCSLHGGGAA